MGNAAFAFLCCHHQGLESDDKSGHLRENSVNAREAAASSVLLDPLALVKKGKAVTKDENIEVIESCAALERSTPKKSASWKHVDAEEPGIIAAKASGQPPSPQTSNNATPRRSQLQKATLMEDVWKQYQSGDMTKKEKDFLADIVTKQPRRPSTLGIGFDAYAEKHSAVFDKVKAMAKSSGWVLKKSVDSVDIFTKSVAGEDLVCTKGTTTMKTFGNGIRHLVAHLLTAEDRPQYDEVCSYGQTIESCLPFYRIVYFQIKSPAVIIAARDVLTLSRLRFEEDGTLVIATSSVDHPAMPDTTSHVRLQIIGGYVIAPTSDPDVFQVTFCVSADPGGWLPGWVKNLIAWKAQLVLAHFKRFYEGAHGKLSS